MTYSSFVTSSGDTLVIDPSVVTLILFVVSFGQTLLSIQSMYDATRKKTVGIPVELIWLHGNLTDEIPMISSSESPFIFNRADPPCPC